MLTETLGSLALAALLGGAASAVGHGISRSAQPPVPITTTRTTTASWSSRSISRPPRTAPSVRLRGRFRHLVLRAGARPAFAVGRRPAAGAHARCAPPTPVSSLELVTSVRIVVVEGSKTSITDIMGLKTLEAWPTRARLIRSTLWPVNNEKYLSIREYLRRAGGRWIFSHCYRRPLRAPIASASSPNSWWPSAVTSKGRHRTRTSSSG
jgi:hypothetical protein